MDKQSQHNEELPVSQNDVAAENLSAAQNDDNLMRSEEASGSDITAEQMQSDNSVDSAPVADENNDNSRDLPDESAEAIEGAAVLPPSDETNEPEDSDISEKGEHEIRAIFEALLFLSNEPLPLSFFTKNFNMDPTDIKILLDSLVDEYEERDGGMKLIEISNGFQFVTNPFFSKDIRRIMGFRRKEPLTKSMLETLSIIAYKQPIILAEIDELRGVSSRMIVAGLMKRNLIKPVGRKELPGRPLAYGTTDEFLRFFGLSRLTDLPKLSEIKEFAYDEV